MPTSPLSPAGDQPASLPAPAAPLIGREDDVAALVALLRGGTRLLTLCGPGGVGKTSLGLQVAATAQDYYTGGVLFVALAAIRDPALVVSEIARVLDVSESGSRSLREGVVEYLRGKRALLFLDNFEQVGAAASVVADLLAACPQLAVLVTSRAPLGMPSEHQFAVQPLALPAPGHVPSASALARYPAVELFMRRAQASGADLEVTAANAATVAAICQRLDGLPLALELAAAWVAVLSPQTLLAQLDDGLAVLAGGAPDLPERQQTLRAAIAWSYDLLEPGEQSLLRRLAGFVGGCTVEAIVQVSARLDGPVVDPAAHHERIVAGLVSLARKNLVRADDAAGVSPPGAMRGVASTGSPPLGRLTLLETIGEYGAERLRANGEARAVAEAHAAYYTVLVETIAPQIKGAAQAAGLALLQQEHDNLRAALAWARTDPVASDTGLRLAAGLGRFWVVRGYLGEGRNWLEELLTIDRNAEVPAAPTLRAKALGAAGALAFNQGDYGHAAMRCGESLRLARTLGDDESVVLALNTLALMAKDQGDYGQAATLCVESLSLAREMGDRWSVVLSLNNLGDVAREQGAYERAATLCAESVALARDLGDSGGLARALDTLGTVVREQGDYTRAMAYYEESIALWRDLGDKQGMAATLDNLGNVALAQGAYGRASDLYEEGLALRRELGDRLGIAVTLDSLGNVALAQGDYARAETLSGQSLDLRRALHDRWGTALALITLGNVALQQGDDAGAAPLFAEGLEVAHEVGKHHGIAGCLEGLAGVAWSRGQRERAVRLWAAAGRLRADSGTPLLPADRARHGHTLAAARIALGSEAFAAAWAVGEGLTLDAAIDEAMTLSGSEVTAEQEQGPGDDPLYRGIFEAGAEGMLVTNPHTGLIVAANPAACRMLGYDHAALIGLSLSAVIHPDYQHLLADYIQAVAADIPSRAQALLLRRDGGTVPVEALGTAFMHRGTRHVLSVVRDVGERVRAEERLWEKEVQYRSIFESTTDGLVITTLEGLIVEANPAFQQMHGYTHQELLGMQAAFLVQGDDRRLLRRFVRAVDDGRPFGMQGLCTRKDGTSFHAEIRGAGFMYRGELHVLGMVRDVSERVRAYELLEQRVDERTRELSALLDVAHNVAATLELQPLLGLILDGLKGVVDYSGAAILTVRGDDLMAVDYRGPLPRERVVGLRWRPSPYGFDGRVIGGREPMIRDDVHGETELLDAYDVAHGERPSGHARSWMGLPLLLNERVIGMLSLVYREPGFYTERHATLALAMAAHAAVALENARLYEQAQAAAALQERQRLARELHDSVSQALYGIALGARTARTLLDSDPARSVEPLEYVLSLSEAGLAEMRALIFELRPEALETEGLVAALQKQAGSLHARYGLAVEATFGPEPQVGLQVKEALYRIAQEALHNTVKHAHARHVEIRLRESDDGCVLEVRDDGQGFDPGAAYPGHLGLHTMQERAQGVGARLQVESGPKQGTLIRVCVPRR